MIGKQPRKNLLTNNLPFANKQQCGGREYNTGQLEGRRSQWQHMATSDTALGLPDRLPGAVAPLERERDEGCTGREQLRGMTSESELSKRSRSQPTARPTNLNGKLPSSRPHQQYQTTAWGSAETLADLSAPTLRHTQLSPSSSGSFTATGPLSLAREPPLTDTSGSPPTSWVQRSPRVSNAFFSRVTEREAAAKARL